MTNPRKLCCWCKIIRKNRLLRLYYLFHAAEDVLVSPCMILIRRMLHFITYVVLFSIFSRFHNEKNKYKFLRICEYYRSISKCFYSATYKKILVESIWLLREDIDAFSLWRSLRRPKCGSKKNVLRSMEEIGFKNPSTSRIAEGRSCLDIYI